MTTYFVSREGNDSAPTTDPGTSGSWTGAYNTLTEAINAALVNGDVIKVSDEHYENVAANTTWTSTGNHLAIIVVDHDDTSVLSQMDGETSYLGNTTTSYTLSLAPYGKTMYVYGLALRTAGSSAATITLCAGSNDYGHFIGENIFLNHRNTASSSVIALGTSAAGNPQRTTLKNCTIRYGHTGQIIQVYSGSVEIDNLIIHASGSVPSSGLFNGNYARGPVTLTNSDVSAISAGFIASGTAAQTWLTMVNCKVHASYLPFVSNSSQTGASPEVWMYNCSSGDYHYHIAHHTVLGSTVVSTTTYCNDNIADTDLSWYVSSTAYATFYNPYVSPWIDVYNDDVSTSVTPSLEGLRASDSDSACDTVAQDDEIWSEWSVQDTSSYTLGVLYSDRMTPLGTAADQTSAKATSDWTIASANDAYKSCFKLACPSAVTPNEVGHVRARVCVGIASKGFFIDPQIRGLA